MNTLIRIFKAGFKNLFRNAWLSTAATAVMLITLLIILTTLISNMALNTTIKGILTKIDVSIYLKDSTTQAQIKNLQAELSQVENVASIQYVSKLDALARYREQNKNNQKLLQAVNELDNPLPASLEVKAKDQKNLTPIADFVNRSDVKPLVDSTSYEKDRKITIDRIIRVSNFINATGLMASLLFTIISILIIFNTIRMAIYSRREELEIMKLIGATKWFIRGPFLCEASLYGFIASIIALVLIYLFLQGIGPKIATYIDFTSTIQFFKHNIILITLGELAVSIVIGATSSMLAMARYLKL